MKTFVTIIISFAGLAASAQPYVSGGNTRHRFAQTYIGLDIQSVPMGGQFTYRGSSGDVLTAPVPGTLRPRITIGGLHFWGHADFYVTFPLTRLNNLPTDAATARFYSGTETGARVYPWRLSDKKIRPFVGMSWTVNSLENQISGIKSPPLIRSRFPLQAGLSYTSRSWIVEAGVSFQAARQYTYYIDRQTTGIAMMPTTTAWVGIKRYFDTTVGAEKSYNSRGYKRLLERMEKDNALGGLSVGIGPSSAFSMHRSSYNTETRPFLGDYRASRIFPEFALGYYFEKPQLHANIAYRRNIARPSAYSVEQSVERRSLGIELFKFLGDYHGFVPFLGPTLSYEQLSVRELDRSSVSTENTWQGIRPGVIFGWDIRPNKLQSIILRTNLRYTPNLRVAMPGGGNVALDQLEFNFIQVVWYPGLTKRIKSTVKVINQSTN